MIHPRDCENGMEDYIFNIRKPRLYYDFIDSILKERKHKPSPKKNKKATKKYADGRQKGKHK